MMKRRTLLKVGIGVPAGVAFAGAGAGTWWWSTMDVDTVGKVPFGRPLAVPPLAESTIDANGVRTFSLTAHPSTAELVPDGRTPTWAYDGDYLGPTLRADIGDTVRVHVRNDLDQTTTVHWHGMHLPASADGGPHQPIEPGGTWSPSWQIKQRPATLWYHPHPHGHTEEHVYRGLAGLFLLEGPDTDVSRRLPQEYGVDDIPLIIQDRTFDQAGQLVRRGFGETILVNGTYGPYLDVTSETVRFRILNASSTRVYRLGFSDGRAFQIIGTDGGLLPHPVRTSRVQVSPGERVEIVVSFTAGEATVLRSYPPDLGMDPFSGAFVGGRDRFDLLQLRAASRLATSPAVPAELAEPPDLDPTAAEGIRRFVLQSGHQINDKLMDMSRIDETVTVDTTEVWEIRNSDGIYHNFHAHDVQYQVIEIDGHRPPAALSGWKDTVMVHPGQTIRLLSRFADYTDPDLPYMYHCHLLPHEDHGMMGQFVVVAPGQRAGTPQHP